MGEKSITGYATSALTQKLSDLSLGDGISTQGGGWVSGEVTIGERKGKSFPIYSLEVEVPFEGTVDGKPVKGAAHLPDVSLEMLDDLEVDFGEVALGEDAAEAIRGAVREWASSVRKAVNDNLANLPLDPPATARTPRAAALISEEEAMSAGGSARLDDADDVEDLPHPDDAEEEGEEEPFTEEEVTELYAQAQAMLKEAVETDQEYDDQMRDLDKEVRAPEEAWCRTRTHTHTHTRARAHRTSHTHLAHTRARTHTRTHTHTHTHQHRPCRGPTICAWPSWTSVPQSRTLLRSEVPT